MNPKFSCLEMTVSLGTHTQKFQDRLVMSGIGAQSRNGGICNTFLAPISPNDALVMKGPTVR